MILKMRDAADDAQASQVLDGDESLMLFKWASAKHHTANPRLHCTRDPVADDVDVGQR